MGFGDYGFCRVPEGGSTYFSQTKGPLRNLLCAAARNAAILLSVAIFPALFWYSYPLGPATTHERSIPEVILSVI